LYGQSEEKVDVESITSTNFRPSSDLGIVPQ